MRLGQGNGQGQPNAMGNQMTANQSNSMGDARPNGDMRQLANTARNLGNDAADVRRQLQQAGVAAKDLAPIDDVVKALRDLSDAKNLQNPKGLQDLYSTAVEKFKVLEFEIRKRVDTTNEQLFLSGSDDVPPAFRNLIQEYYKSLSKKPGGGGK